MNQKTIKVPKRTVVSLDDLPTEDKKNLSTVLAKNDFAEINKLINYLDVPTQYAEQFKTDESKLSIGYVLDNKQYNFQEATKTVGPFKKGQYYLANIHPLLGVTVVGYTPRDMDKITSYLTETLPKAFSYLYSSFADKA